jgi:hypothetical protein
VCAPIQISGRSVPSIRRATRVLTMPPSAIRSPRPLCARLANFLVRAAHLFTMPPNCSPRRRMRSSRYRSYTVLHLTACHLLAVPALCTPRQLSGRPVPSARRAVLLLAVFHPLAACHRLRTSHLFAVPSCSLCVPSALRLSSIRCADFPLPACCPLAAPSPSSASVYDVEPGQRSHSQTMTYSISS